MLCLCGESRTDWEKVFCQKVIFENGLWLVRWCHVAIARFPFAKRLISKQPFAPNGTWLEREVEPTDRIVKRYGAPL